MALKNRQRPQPSKETQQYGLYNPETKTFEGERAWQDNQQRYDDDVQESEVVWGREDDVEVPERAIDGKNFAQDFYHYSRGFQDNDNGTPGVDDDYGIYNQEAESFESEEGAGSPEEEALSVKTIQTLGGDETIEKEK